MSIPHVLSLFRRRPIVKGRPFVSDRPSRSVVELIAERDNAIAVALDSFTYVLGLFRAYDEANESFVRRLGHEHPELADDLVAILQQAGPWSEGLAEFRHMIDRMIRPATSGRSRQCDGGPQAPPDGEEPRSSCLIDKVPVWFLVGN